MKFEGWIFSWGRSNKILKDGVFLLTEVNRYLSYFLFWGQSLQICGKKSTESAGERIVALCHSGNAR